MIQDIDNIILRWANQLVDRSLLLDNFLIFLAQWLVYLLPIVLVIIWFWLRYWSKKKDYFRLRINLIMIVLSGIIGWQLVSGAIKAFYFRPRPYVEESVRELLFHRPDESFPSDHTILLFAISTYCYLLGWKKIGNWTLLVAILVSLARIITGIHWTSDILGGIILGITTAYMIWRFKGPLVKIIKPIVEWADKYGL